MGRTQDLGGATDDATRTQNLTCSAFSLLASAATAHAECAWVVWQHDRYDYAKLERFGSMTALRYFEDRDPTRLPACHIAMKRIGRGLTSASRGGDEN